MSILGKVTLYVERARERRELQCHARKLASLSDHLLDDIGVTRAQVSQIAVDAFGVRAAGHNVIL
ncbi:DUF1127 domain-containing protein [Shinella curvata]|uniref:DUF1127 domain-containing protein n=1 Tax=Shinella curvata TaxID=1817964 RepID=A0ABT8XAI6_9HYPH|nr:DUF1127 domain-containing protein [Shinella curvata]MCJ8055150.1 DUF1127 domain-containing protein [Shinella curvata]MDO6120454.1 DUF1127 domain-containing protein [Shinella curvata]